MIGFAPALDVPYNFLPKRFRVLWHQSRNQILKYRELPNRTINFDLYPIFHARHTNELTLSSTISTRHQGYMEDAEITEIWLAEDLSMQSGFFYMLRDFYSTLIGPDDFLIWYPKDRTDKAFAIQPLKISVGDENQLDVNPIHDASRRDYRWLRSEVRFTFKVLRILDTPDAVAFLEGV